MLPKLTDLNPREFGMLLPLVFFVFWIGLYPKPLLEVMHGSVARVLASQSEIVTVGAGQGADERSSLFAEGTVVSQSPTGKIQ